MESTGRLVSIQRDWETDKWQLTFEINENPTEDINELKKCDKLSIVFGKFKKKRSLDANAYLWILVTKIANHPSIASSKEEVYEQMLQKYGYLDEDENGHILITLRTDIDISRIGGHWKFYKGNGKFNAYLSIKGTSEYNSSEMAHFLEKVIEEAKELGIQTATPSEIARMNELWRKMNG